MIRRLINIVTTILVAVIVAIALLMVAARFIGAGSYVIQSGSMEPAYHTGSLIFDKKVKPEELKSGDVITFSIADDMTATHRIVEVIVPDDTEVNPDGTNDIGSSSLKFRTKGDANEEADAEPVSAENIVGMPVFEVPYLGYIINFLR